MIAILIREELKEYNFGEDHPFKGNRYRIFLEFVESKLLKSSNFRILKAEWAIDKELSLICEKDYIDFSKKYYKAVNLGLTHPAFRKFSQYHSADNLPRGKPGKIEEAARLVVGQAKKSVDVVLQGNFSKAISIGGGLHHAKRNYGEGFCIYNDVAFAAKYAIERYELKRILILDTDAHAGNGTAKYFYDDPRVLFIDLHQDPKSLYPGTGFVNEIGAGKGTGYTVNCPLIPDTGWDSYQYIFDEIIFPLVKEFKPQLIIRNGGTDPYWNDELTQLGLTVDDFREIGENVRELAKICDGKEIDMIGSGYNEKVLPYGWLALISGLAGIKVSTDEVEPVPAGFKKDLRYKDTKIMVEELKENLKNYWRCFNK